MSRLGFPRPSFPSRLIAFAAVLAIESFLTRLIPHHWFGGQVYRGSPALFGLAVLFFSWPQLVQFHAERFPFRSRFAGLNLASLAIFLMLGAHLGRLSHDHYPVTNAPSSFWILAAFWFALVPVMVLSAIAAILPLREAGRLMRRIGISWLYAGVCTILVVWLREYFRATWDAPSATRLGWFMQRIAIRGAALFLHPFYPDLIVNPRACILGTSRFLITILGTCSGAEGITLVTVFSLAWILFTRKELYVRRALLLVPIAATLMWIFNMVRIATLIVIGDHGHPAMAMTGFHSQAGWIAFNLVSIAFLLVANRIQWFRRPHRAAPAPQHDLLEDAADHNEAAVYLGPFLAILAASFISQAATGGFEWLYPLRFFAALLALWLVRRHLRAMDWRFSWLGIATGAIVAAFWFAAHHLLFKSNPANDVTTLGLAHLSTLHRIGWISIRILATVTTVPIAEELAFRGFLARRILARHVASVPYARLNWIAIAVSSVAFGLMHGKMWIAGILTGILFALVAKLRNRLGEAVAAHVVANLVLAVLALILHDYTLW